MSGIKVFVMFLYFMGTRQKAQGVLLPVEGVSGALKQEDDGTVKTSDQFKKVG